MNKKITLDQLLSDGFTKRMAQSYVQKIEDENANPRFDKDYLSWSHENGFLAEHALSVGVTEDNYKEYLSDYDHMRIWPLNDWERIWVNDKMTLKYMLEGTKYNDLMPEYYFYMSDRGLREMIDNPYKGRQEVDTLLQVLREKKVLAAKPNNSTLGAGFLEMGYLGGNEYLVNGIEKTEGQIAELVLKNKNYIYLEYLKPSEPFRSIDPRLHTLRMITLNENGNDPILFEGTTVRFANQDYAGANLLLFDAGSDENAYNLYMQLNPASGEYNWARMVYGAKESTITEEHPVTGLPLKGRVEDFDKIVQIVLGIAEHFFALSWLAFDICLTEKGIKVLEINTHPGMLSSQVIMSLKNNPRIRNFLEQRLNEIDNLSEFERVNRAAIVR